MVSDEAGGPEWTPAAAAVAPVYVVQRMTGKDCPPPLSRTERCTFAELWRGNHKYDEVAWLMEGWKNNGVRKNSATLSTTTTTGCRSHSHRPALFPLNGGMAAGCSTTEVARVKTPRLKCVCVHTIVCPALRVSEMQRRIADTPKAGTQVSRETRLCRGTTGRPLVIREGGHVVLAAANCASASVYSSGGTR
ncbi:hypothetical protein MRX96_053581 [Rhipicephalus microplus]